MKWLIKFLFILLIHLPLHAQWEVIYADILYPPPTPISKDGGIDISFINKDTGYIAGYPFGVLKTMDGGQSWTQAWDLVPYTLNTIQFLNADSGYVAYEQELFRTADGGNNWEDVSPNSAIYPPRIAQMDFINFDTGYVSGFYMIKTTDAFNTFTEVDYTGFGVLTSIHQGSIFAFDNGTIYISHNDELDMNQHRVRKSTDFGNTWSLLNIWEMSSIFFVNDTLGYGYILGDIFRTTDGGSSWELRKNNAFNTFYGSVYSPYKYYLFSRFMYFPSADTGYAINRSPEYSIVKTADGGESWEVTDSFDFCDPCTIRKLYCIDNNTCYVVIYSSYVRIVARTTTGGIYTGVADKSSSTTSIKIYPNPARSSISISGIGSYIGKDKVEIKIYNAVGSLVHRSIPNDNNLELDLSSGVYYLSVMVNNEVIDTEKLVIIN